MTSFHPTQEDFVRLADEATVVPVSRTLVADTLTPVMVRAMLGSEPGTFLLESVEGGEKWGRFSFVGFGPQRILRGRGDRFECLSGGETQVQEGIDPWDCLRTELARYSPAEADWLPRFWGGAVGYVSYDSVHRFEPSVPGQGEAWEFCFGVGATVLIFDQLRQLLHVVVPALLMPGDDASEAYARSCEAVEAAVRRLEAPVRLATLEPPVRGRVEESLPDSNFTLEDFESAVLSAQDYIRQGEIFQVVLSQRFRVPTEETEVLNVYRAMRVVNPSPYMYLVDFEEASIAGASPETLVRLEDGVAEVRPIAGTRHRGKDAAEDEAIAEELLADPKERAEHVMLVDLGRNDLGRISQPGSVEITERMCIERYSHVMHIVSNVRGKLQPGRDALDVLRATFPAGTLSGAPKVRAMQIISELEPESRGVYGGAVGYIAFDGNMDVAIAIRTVVARDGEMWLQAGAGIVEASCPASEYQETLNKARAGLVAIETGRRARREE